MAAALLQKILKKPLSSPTTLRALASLNIPHQPDILSNPVPYLHQNPNPPAAAAAAAPLVHPDLQIYPTFPYWINLDPIAQPPLDPPAVEVVSGDEAEDRTVWADSVKKKRKRKMNKHKLQKLRKSLRRKT